MENGVIQDVRMDKQTRLPILQQISFGVTVYSIQILNTIVHWYRERTTPSKFTPNIIKYYQCRPSLSVRIFFPKSYDPNTSQAPLPTLFSIHGGGFCFGDPSNDDKWNSNFASMHNVLVISLNYRKAPSYPFPTATYDLGALMLATFDDESLPIDKSRIAVGGFSAGGSLTLSVCQLPSIREKVKPKAAIPIYAVVDKSIPMEIKTQTRYYKPDLGSGMRAESTDYLEAMSPMFFWSYINPGTDLKDPLLSPYFAPRDTLPPHIFFISAELDQLVHESWCMASKIAGRPEPTFSERAGREKRSAGKGELILDDERFAFEHKDEDGKSSVRWLLVPDQIHGFDKLPEKWQGEEGFEDAGLKETAYQKLAGEWLYDVAWK
ncbi:alpha/beta-hydrolase [Annulohypoxylon maeteangense]|uniref:alpha/beta-hydrolase n=1 Tax=Annulohypoxylon maeteangense TaxID=1927788 RepID=UPI0020085D5F|nr:alpha/beta-hydrolase [Annulohypoxylon maeteangense]KAI0888405.1 alpha/beta-hydrolase [Annulohypoxylon maeteangense]